MERKGNWKKWVTLALCGIAGSVIYKLPYMRETYYAAMQEATGASNAQLGFLMSAYGLVNFLLYLPGGWAADKFSARKLMTFSLVSTGITGFYYATFPPYIMIVLLHALWAVTTVFTFWAVCVRIIRNLGESTEQGRLYGFWYLGKGLTSMVLGFISVPIFANFGEGVPGLKSTIIFYSIVTILTGLLSWFIIDDDTQEAEKSTFKVSDMKEVLKMPAMWLAGIVTFSMWSIYIGFGMVTPYLTQVFHMGESKVALASILRAYILFAIGGLIGGQLADRFKSRTRFMIYAFVGMIIFTIVYIMIPGDSKFITLALINMVALGSFIYCANAVFFSIIDEVNIPKKVTGTAAGLLSLLTYFPEIYCYTMVGNMVDRNPGISGFRNVFFFMLGCSICGLIAALILQKINKNNKVKNTA
ncbi:MFS transporter [Sebaldella sp. S0638]|uniref:MFS transporter n=1 Tax=Sebaldella sp. S0638 TaxID=2957809 RepID=UPI00209DE6F1|nr:MFS transporter [Sebaldella sp. S0638]MCP1225956.1 MFS transporter [Sebaldella sp. S0638]